MRLTLVIPAYNEAAAIGRTLATLESELASLPLEIEVVVVNDGSVDDTSDQARAFRSARMQVVVVELSRNFGKEAALSAGLEIATGDAVIPLDADLQDPPELIPRMVQRWQAGAEVVLARRSDRRSDSLPKRFTARQFYRFINRVSDVAIPHDVGDFRLMDRCVVDVVRALPENRRFMKGLFAWAGFRTETIDYARAPRVAGRTKFNALRLFNLAVEGITSFSTVPLRFASFMGAAVALGAFGYGSWTIAKTLIYGRDLPGYPSLLTAVLFLSGIQLLALGIIGEYVGRTYLESKRRPAFVIRRIWRESAAASDPDFADVATAPAPDAVSR